MSSIIAGKYKNKRLLKAPQGSLRPSKGTLKKSLFDSIHFDLQNALFLDCFAGLGAIGLEALSQGAKKVYFIEKNKQIGKILKKNISLLDEVPSTEVYFEDVESACKKIISKKITFDLIFADPPYGQKNSFYQSFFFLLEKLAHQDTLLILEERLGVSIPETSWKCMKYKKIGKSCLFYYKKHYL